VRRAAWTVIGLALWGTVPAGAMPTELAGVVPFLHETGRHEQSLRRRDEVGMGERSSVESREDLQKPSG